LTLSGIKLNVTLTNTGSASSGQIIQIVDHRGVDPASVPIAPGRTHMAYGVAGQRGVRFVDGGTHSPFATQSVGMGREAVTGQPYANTNGTIYGVSGAAVSNQNTGTISSSGGTTTMTFGDNPGAQTAPNSTLTFQVIVVATNFYGSGQNVVMGVYNWGYNMNGTAVSNSTFTPTTMSARSRATLANNYGSYRLNE
jgi:hypothetical protein